MCKVCLSGCRYDECFTAEVNIEIMGNQKHTWRIQKNNKRIKKAFKSMEPSSYWCRNPDNTFSTYNNSTVHPWVNPAVHDRPCQTWNGYLFDKLHQYLCDSCSENSMKYAEPDGTGLEPGTRKARTSSLAWTISHCEVIHTRYSGVITDFIITHRIFRAF